MASEARRFAMASEKWEDLMHAGALSLAPDVGVTALLCCHNSAVDVAAFDGSIAL